MLQKAKSFAPALRFTIILHILILTALFLAFFWGSRSGNVSLARHTGTHILFLLPCSDEETDVFQQETAEMADRFHLQLEFINTPSVTVQKSYLSLIPKLGVDAVLLWPISGNEEDYKEELVAIREANIPVALIYYDFADKELRNSYIGSGIDSESIVLNQFLYEHTSDRDPIIIASCSRSESADIIELLVMRRNAASSPDRESVKNGRLREFLDLRLPGYEPERCISIQSAAGNMNTLSKDLNAELNKLGKTLLLFSLDATLTEMLAANLNSGITDKDSIGTLIGYGEQSRLQEFINNGTISELLFSDVHYSAQIGIRYLNDICAGFYVPPSLDSGVQLVFPPEAKGTL